MELQTIVEIPKNLPPITHDGPILMLGSCFAENIGQLLKENKFHTDINPHGILYNPLSVSAAIREIIAGKTYTRDDLFFYQEAWHSPMHHGSFSSPDAETVLARINSRIEAAHTLFPCLSYLIITFGTAYVYETQGDHPHIVSNCHKLPERNFRRRLLSTEEIAETYRKLIPELLQQAPRMNILLTVSPIRHIRDGLHANQISKSTLLLATEQLCREFHERVHYFPSYEIVMDELRDYRFYADDMAHPSPLAVNYLWERFSEAFFPPDTQDLIRRIEEIERGTAHKPFRPDSTAYKDFLRQIMLKIERLNEKYPYLDFQKETELCRTRLNP